MTLKFLKSLEKMRAYSDDTKRLIGYSVSGGLTVLIVATSFAIPGYPKKEVPKPEPERHIASPFSAIRQELSDSFSSIQRSVDIPSKAELGLFLKNLSSSQMVATSSPKNSGPETSSSTPEMLE